MWKKLIVVFIFFALIIFSQSEFRYQKPIKTVNIDTLFIKDSLEVFNTQYVPKSVWTDPLDTSQEYYTLEYVESLFHRLELNKIQFLVPLSRYKPLYDHLRQLPVLVVTGRQYRNELTGAPMSGDFINGKFVGSSSRALVIPYGEYIDNKEKKYAFEVIDTVPKGNVKRGMESRIVKKALGEPLLITKCVSPEGKEIVQWAYDDIFRFDGTRQKLDARKFIYFLDDKVITVKN